MADVQSNQRGDPHNWNTLEQYVFLHEMHLDNHPLVLPGSYLEMHEILTPDAPYDVLVVEGLLYLANGLNLEIHKSGDLDRTAARKVRMRFYSYNAWIPGKHNVLRYDNLHRDNEDEYHKHMFDPQNGDEIQRTEMTRAEFPVMHQILDEAMQLSLPPI